MEENTCTNRKQLEMKSKSMYCLCQLQLSFENKLILYKFIIKPTFLDLRFTVAGQKVSEIWSTAELLIKCCKNYPRFFIVCFKYSQLSELEKNMWEQKCLQIENCIEGLQTTKVWKAISDMKTNTLIQQLIILYQFRKDQYNQSLVETRLDYQH